MSRKNGGQIGDGGVAGAAAPAEGAAEALLRSGKAAARGRLPPFLLPVCWLYSLG
jgi:hypothetical protein